MIVGNLLTYEMKFGKRSNLFIGFRGDTIPMRQSPKLVSPVKSGDINPFQLLCEYLEYRYPSTENSSMAVYQEMFDIYKRCADYITNNDFIINEFETTPLHEMMNIVSFYEVRSWVSNRIVPPAQHINNTKGTFGKDDVRTFDGPDYLDLCALVITTSAVSPIMAALVYKTEIVSKKQTFCAIYDFTEEILGENLPIFEKYVGNVDLIQRTKASLNAINNETSFDDGVQILAATTLYGRLSTHNILTDGGGKTLVTRLNQVILGKTDKKDVNATKERSNVRGDKAVSSFDLVTPYEYTGDIIQDYIWITEDPIMFVEQVYKDGLPDHLAKHYNDGLKYVIGTPSPEVVAMMAVILRHYIAPEALTLLGIEREGVKPQHKSIDVCRAVAYMEIVDDFPDLAYLILSKREDSAAITLGDNITQNKLKRDALKHYSFTNTIMPVINALSDVVKYEYTCKLPFLETEFFSINRSIRVDLVEMFNMCNDRYIERQKESLCI